MQQVVESLIFFDTLSAKQVKISKIGPFFEVLFKARKLLDKSQIKCSIEKSGFGNLPYFTSHDLRFAEKKLLIFEF